MLINNMFTGELQPSTTVGGCIDIFENAWPNPDETVARIEQECSNVESGVGWSRAGTVGQGHKQQARTNLGLGITLAGESVGNQAMQDIHNQMYFLLLASSIPYADRYEMNEYLYHEQYQALKYRGGEEYKAHYDGSTESGRCISALIYLNDDYEGGHLEFPNYKIKLKPEKGMLILFPSNYAYKHVAHPVTEGTKYSLVTWIHDRPLQGM
jgi:predicted 2-oxoglutarate/Fe(II)-dependent dioxygenase YbiX|tara:strand:+ start:1628 stop:2260 length:633 start_codon:yes stop_codon:yes gene_type:complete